MAKPAEAPLAENVRFFVLPLDVQNALQAPQVEAVAFPLLAHVGGPYLAAVEEHTEHAGLVDVHFGLHSETGVIPDPLLQSGHNCCCLGNPAVHLCISGEQAEDGRPEVSEVLHFQVISINVDGWRMVSGNGNGNGIYIPHFLYVYIQMRFTPNP